MKEWTFFFCLHPFPFTPASKQNLQHRHWVLSFISVLFLTVSLQPGRGVIISPVCWRWVRSLSLSFRSIPNHLTLPALCSLSVDSSALRGKPQILHIRHSWRPSTLALQQDSNMTGAIADGHLEVTCFPKSLLSPIPTHSLHTQAKCISSVYGWSETRQSVQVYFRLWGIKAHCGHPQETIPSDSGSLRTISDWGYRNCSTFYHFILKAEGLPND